MLYYNLMIYNVLERDLDLGVNKGYWEHKPRKIDQLYLFFVEYIEEKKERSCSCVCLFQSFVRLFTIICLWKH